MTIYLDLDFKCHVTNDGTMRPYETDAFNDKCEAYIEGYRLVPQGETWIREDGTEFIGLMSSPWKNSTQLEKVQYEYEHELLKQLKAQNAEYESALTEIEEALGVNE